MNNHEKCLSCEHIPCANLSLKKGELDGGELYVLDECIMQKKVVPCQPITPLYSCCLLCQAARKTLNIEEELVPPLLLLTWQCLYDLKTSAFLALTAHYRGSIQLLRPVIENILTGLYFEERLSRSTIEDEVEQTWADFDKWGNDQYKISEIEWKKVMSYSEEERKRRLGYGFLIQWLNKEGILRRRGIYKFDTIQRQLNKYLHPYFEQMDIGTEKCSKCPATTRYDENRYYEWLELFQNIITFVIEIIFVYYPSIEKTEEADEAMNHLKDLELLERDLKMPMIKSRDLSDLIKALYD
ncbi:MAG: hypothetical protein K8R17_07640 [Methanosarcinales archaeon]|nr:hypothetical protein [Methanosarcinales archaeon]